MTTDDVVQSEQVEETASREEIQESAAAEASAPQSGAPENSAESEGSPEQSGDDVRLSAQPEEVSEEPAAVETNASEQCVAAPSGDATSEVPQGPQLTPAQKVGLLEALLLASGDPLPIARVEELLLCTKSDVLALA